jgi:hypothetical protein
MDGDADVLAVARQVFVDGVIDDFKNAVMQAALIGVANIHAGAHADGAEAFEMLDLIGTIRLVCGDVSGVGKVVDFVGHDEGKSRSPAPRIKAVFEAV